MEEDLTIDAGTVETQSNNGEIFDPLKDPLINDQQETQEEPRGPEKLEGESEENKKFTVDEIDFSDDVYKVGEYDLSKYKDTIPEYALSQLEDIAKEYADNGFSQEQIEFLLDKELGESPERTREDVMKELNKTLTLEEKRNYKAVGSQLKGILESNNLGQFYEEAMSNPIVYRIINTVFNSKGASIGAKTERETRTNKLISGEKAVNMFNDLINKGEIKDVKAKAKELYGMLATDEDRELFKEIVYTNLK